MDEQKSAQLYAGNFQILESLYDSYLANPASVSQEWRDYFATFPVNQAVPEHVSREAIMQFYRERARTCATSGSNCGGETCLQVGRKQSAVLRLIHAYRLLGHHRAEVDPINLRAKPTVPDLDPEFHGLDSSDLDTVFNTGGLGGMTEMKLRDIVALLRATYTGPMGFEFMHISNLEENRWLQQRIEQAQGHPAFSAEAKLRLLERITAAEGLEVYLHSKYVGQKRFSLEGGETLITALDQAIQRAGEQDVREIVIGMAHRGRLNVLVNVLGKAAADLFLEFEGKQERRGNATGDVKYHQGFSSDIATPGGIVHLALGFNPSHLEIIDPVTCGSVRARQDRRGDQERKQVMAILVHGDSSFAGQGVVYETLNLSQTRGYGTGGTLHLVVNNRIGFTTSHPLDVSSTLYCTDVGKVIQAPIFHVNGDDPEAVAFTTQLAVDFRHTFKRDVIVDVVCYRRHGHNEADEPAATQPMMYRKIRQHPTTRHMYAEALVRQGVLSAGDDEAMVQDYHKALEAGRQVAVGPVCELENIFRVDWKRYRAARWDEETATALSAPEVLRLGTLATTIPEGFELHPRVAKIVEDRKLMAAGALPIDWGFAETIAYGSLLENGFAIRITGQDSGRGTFFHRHAVFHDQGTGDEYIPLQHLSPGQARFAVINSILSEEAALGFEYGYSAASPHILTIWEGQFGDFVNGAQVVIDQFIAAAEQKWGLLTGLTLLLPHGWEGQGPEHTSGRLERFLQLCAQENIQVCYPSTPSQIFHMLRRQMLRPYRKPLVVMTPKSMLRQKISFSPLAEITDGKFQEVIGEVDPLRPEQTRRVVLCSGKVYYDLLEARRERKLEDIAILRIEQMYPFPSAALSAALQPYRHVRDFVWCQEEPQNQGAWYIIQHAIRTCLPGNALFNFAGRMPMAAPSEGSHNQHVASQKKLVDDALSVPAFAGETTLTLQPQLVATAGVYAS